MITHLITIDPTCEHATLSAVDDGNDMSKAEALDVSIQKWKIIDALYRKHHFDFVSDGAGFTCGLCVKYADIPSVPPCHGCPVQERTGRPWCSGSPYREYTSVMDSEDKARAAQDEIKFLESLKKVRNRNAKGQFSS